MAKKAAVVKPNAKTDGKKKRYLSQEDVPSFTLTEALRIPEAIKSEYASEPTRPLQVAKALNVQPSSPTFRQRCGASIAYGLTEGGYNAATIALLPLAKRILSPTVDGDDLIAKREALLKPRVIGLFLTKYDGSKLPREEIAHNVLEDMGVPRDVVKRTYDLIISGARELGLITEISGMDYVDLKGTTPPVPATDEDEDAAIQPPAAMAAQIPSPAVLGHVPTPSQTTPGASRIEYRKKRVFITHGKDTGFIDTMKKLLAFGEMEAVVSVEKTTVSIGVPEKVMNDMRSCGAAIIHVDHEGTGKDREEKDIALINPNVLIEIGAAMALYGKRFILLVRKGVTLPTNLQGLFEVRYEGTTLDGIATIKLLEAIQDIKNHNLPE